MPLTNAHPSNLEMLPSAFSALFSGETEPQTQRMVKDTKLLDAVFDAGLAPYRYSKILQYTLPLP